MAQLGPAGGEVDAGRQDPGQGGERPLDATDAGGAAHALDRDDGGCLGHLVARLTDRLHGPSRRRSLRQCEARAAGGKVDGNLRRAGQGGERPLDAAGTGGAAHALDGQGQPDAGGLGGGRRRQGEVVRGRFHAASDGASHHGKVKARSVMASRGPLAAPYAQQRQVSMRACLHGGVAVPGDPRGSRRRIVGLLAATDAGGRCSPSRHSGDGYSATVGNSAAGLCDDSERCSGRLTRTVVPRPGSLSMMSLPRCRLSVCLTMASPSPVPPC